MKEEHADIVFNERLFATATTKGNPMNASAIAAKDRVQWDRRRPCAPCSENEAMRFVHDMDAASPVVRLLLQFGHMILDDTDSASLLYGQGGDEDSRVRIIGFTQTWDGTDVECLSRYDGCADDCRTVGSAAACRILPAMQDGAGADDAIRSIRKGGKASEFPSMLASYAIGDEPWARGMAGLLKRIGSWADGLPATGLADDDHVKSAVVSTVVHAFDEAFRRRGKEDRVSPASLAMSMALGRCMPDDELSNVRRRCGADFPRIGFRMVEYALRVGIEHRLKARRLMAADGRRESMATWQWANTMFAAITCPGFMSDPWNAFMVATETMNRLFTRIGDNDEIRSWTVGGGCLSSPTMPWRRG